MTMNIKLIKELESLEDTLTTLNNQYFKIVDQKASDYEKSIFDDFENYFSSDFQISRQYNSISAVYGKTTISLTKQHGEYIGAYFKFTLKHNVLGIHEYNISVCRKDTSPYIRISGSPSDSCDDKALQSKINEYNDKIRTVKNNLENPDIFFYLLVDGTKTSHFNSLKELLTELFPN